MATQTQSIYQRLQAIGAEMDSHESDLYVRWTPDVGAILKTYEFRTNCQGFTGRDGKPWVDIPFAYDPWWERRAKP